jgi:hypothetical protein
VIQLLRIILRRIFYSVCRLVHKVINSGVGLLLPERFQVTLLDGLFAIGRAQVSPAFLSSLNPIGSARVLEVQRILREGQSLQLQFPAEDLGFRFALAIIPVQREFKDNVISSVCFSAA